MILEEEIKEEKEEQNLSEDGLARWHSPGCRVVDLLSYKRINSLEVCFDVLVEQLT